MRLAHLLIVGVLSMALPMQSAIADADAEREALARIAHELDALEPLIREAESQANPDACSNEPNAPGAMDTVPQAPVPDADTPADTIKTLTANVAAMTAEVEALRQNNTRLHDENKQLLNNRVQIEENVTTRVKRELLSREHDQEARQRMDSSVLSSLTARVDALSQSLTSAESTPNAGDIPVGLGFDGGGTSAQSVTGLVWINPLDAIDSDVGAANGNGLLHPMRQSTGGALSSAREQTGNIARELETLRPMYTVPRNAALIGSTAMTALVGRVPVRGQVRDPMPFKVITGADNLAANGLTVPGVQGMVWSGTAIGDWTLSCVTGRLDSVTFVFDDGTIRTISGDDRGGQTGSSNRPLGWISDQQGIPCISGDRKTNAPAFLTQRIGVMAVQAAADAADAELVEREMAQGNKLYPLGIAFYVRGDNPKMLRANVN